MLRRNDLQKAKSFLKFTACFVLPLHQVEQVIVAADQIVGFYLSRQIDIRLVFRIARIDKTLGYLPDKGGVLLQAIE